MTSPKTTTTTTSSPPFKVLIFSKTAGYRHASIPAGISALQRLALSSLSSSNPFTAEATEDPSVFDSASSLSSTYRVIILLQCSGDFLSPSQLSSLQSFIEIPSSPKKGIVAIHCASCGHPSSEWYTNKAIGASFSDHPEPQKGIVRVVDLTHPILVGSLGKGDKGVWTNRKAETKEEEQEEWEWEWLDEWYNFKTHPLQVKDQRIHVLLTVDEASYKGGNHGDDHPIAWCREFDGPGNRSFYTALGHFDEAYKDEGFMSQLLGGILWTAGVYDEVSGDGDETSV
ncbi:ThuA-like domain-containing protein [Apodospora peruviana]|uniref:ThuA-like domain-containing protein n=1 Tax=Apodospora peruviana TaxID=516989 RepID=A0AAE0MA78_9PEZI|nr:ThuA-like domain-containing protein [Apodospora peruviana]